MIPLKLQLRNFLSYGDPGQTVDFAPYQLICLSGKNGHGKSAMLDAMTWAVWGQARKIGNISRADEGLLRLGARSMCVIFDFMCAGVTYRVRRELGVTNAGKSYTNLEFGLIGADDAITALTEKTMRQTQDAIERIVGLSFDSFVNSVFLRQGQSNEFSKKTAKERKEILASILGVDEFENVREKALERIRVAIAERDSFGKLQERLAAELARIEQVRTSVQQIRTEYDELSVRQQALAKDWQRVTQMRAQCAEHTARLKALGVTCAQARESAQRLRQQLSEAYAQWRRVHYVRIARPDDGVPVREHIAQLRERDEQLRQLAVCYAQADHECANTHKECALAVQKSELEHERKRAAVAVELNGLMHEHKQAQMQVAQLETRAKQLAIDRTQLERQVREIAQEQERGAATSTEFVAARRVLEKQRDVFARVTAHAEQLERERVLVHNQLACLGDECQAHCPLCQQQLSNVRAQSLRQQLQTAHSFHEHRHLRLNTFMATWRLAIQEGEQKLQAQAQAGMLAERLKERHAQIVQRADELAYENQTCTNELERARQRERALGADYAAKEREHASVLAAEAVADPNIIALRTACQAQEMARAAIAYDASAHEQVRQQIAALERQQAQLQELTDQQAQQGQRLSHIQMLLAAARVLDGQLTAHERERAACANTLAQAEVACVDLERACAGYDELTKRLQDLLTVRVRAEHDLERLEMVAHEHQQYVLRIKELEKEIYQYRAISTALGKDGIQALLIEAVIPELENEANTLLARLTDNNAQIFIESLRDLKRGGTRETLDINISDNAGIRPYELFSGGEAFRIDFALRVALSKLLARRAGAALQTLVIDEGFGSQDEEGLARVMDALYRVQNDFAKIIVVSHLEALKQQFPVQFVVEKGPLGSQVSVFEQG